MSFWRHVKRNALYHKLNNAKLCVSDLSAVQDGCALVVYVDADGNWFARPAYEFHDGRFIKESKP